MEFKKHIQNSSSELIVGSREPFISFKTTAGEQSYFDFKDGKWQFWGEASVDDSAKALFDVLAQYLEKYIVENKENFRKLLD